MNRNEVITEIEQALRRRSGKVWSVTGGRGTAYGWIAISVPPARRGEYGYINDDERAELGALLGLPKVHSQGVSIPASSVYYQEYIDRAQGKEPSVIGQPYWD